MSYDKEMVRAMLVEASRMRDEAMAAREALCLIVKKLQVGAPNPGDFTTALDRLLEAERTSAAAAMLRLVERRLRFVCEGESGVAQVGLRLALAELPPFAQRVVLDGIVERDRREGGSS